MFSLFYTLHTGIASPGYCRREYLVTVQTYARATEHMETPKPRTSESGQLVSSLKLANCADRRRTTDYVGLTRRSPHRITLRVCGCGSLLAHKLRASLRSLSASAHRSVEAGSLHV